MKFFRSIAYAVAFGLSALSGSVQAGELGSAASDIVLTVTGEIVMTNQGNEATFDLAMLSRMTPETIETTTIWTDGIQQFQGVSLATLLDMLSVEDGTLIAAAINDYSVEIPVDDAVSGGPIIAYMQNGEEMSVRDKGPLWIVYPYDSDPRYKSEVIYARSIWQLDRIEVRR